MQSTTAPERSPSPRGATGKTVELGRYETNDGRSRVLVGRRVNGTVRVFDVAPDEPTRGYHVESGFESYGELAMLIADYKRQARRLGSCPMSRKAIRVLLELEEASR